MEDLNFNLDELATNVGWLSNVKSVHSSKLYADDSIYVSFSKTKKTDPTIDHVRLKLGADVMRHMGWNFKDKIAIFNHPDDLMLFKLVKSDVGRSIHCEGGSKTYGTLLLRWRHNLKLQATAPHKVDFVVYKDSVTQKPTMIFFRVGKEKVEYGLR